MSSPVTQIREKLAAEFDRNGSRRQGSKSRKPPRPRARGRGAVAERAERMDAHRAAKSLPISGRAIREIGRIESAAFHEGQRAAVTWLETQVYGGIDPLSALARLGRTLFPAQPPTSKGSDQKEKELMPLTDAELAQRVRDADVVVLLTEGGTEARSFVKGVGPVPLKWEIGYGEKDDPPGTIRQFTLRGGWNRTEWRKLDRSALTSAADAEMTEAPDGQ